MLTSSQEKDQALIAGNELGLRLASWRLLLNSSGLILCVGVAIITCLCQNLRQESSLTTMAYDSGHYLGTAQLLVAALFGQLQHLDAAQLFTRYGVKIAELPTMLLLDGPLVPALGALVFALLGRVPGGGDWQVFVMIESAFQAAATALVYLCATRLSGRKVFGTVAGLLWATYPAAIIGCNNFLSEVPICCLALAFVFCLAKLSDYQPAASAGKFVVTALIGGVCAALVFITKPALMLAVAASICTYFIFKGWRNGAKMLSVLAVGVSMIVLPWAFWTHHETGQVYFSARRVPTLNIVKGSDVTTDGWNTIPCSSYSALFPESMGPGKALWQIWSEHPQELLNLSMRKIERLWAFPWNDFRRNALGLSIASQTWWHRVLFLIGLAGVMAFLMRRQVHASANIIGWSCLAFTFGHFSYIPFETLSRYGFTAMPFLVIMAGYAFYAAAADRLWLRLILLLTVAIAVCVLQATSLLPLILTAVPELMLACQLEFAIRTVAVLLLAWLALSRWGLRPIDPKPGLWAPAFVSLVVLISLASLFAHLTNAGDLREWRCTLKPGQMATRNIRSDTRGAQWALALIDADQTLAHAEVVVNGKVLNGIAASNLIYDPAHYYLYSYLQEIAVLNKKDPLNLRQWRAIVVPLDYLSASGVNTISVRPKDAQRVTVYGAYPAAAGSRQRLPSLSYISPSKLLKNLDVLETRVTDQVYSVAAATDSVLVTNTKIDQNDLSNDAGRQPGQYRIYLAIGRGVAPAQLEALPAGIETKIKSSTFGQVTGIDDVIVSYPLQAKFPLTSALQRCQHLSIHMTGELKSVLPVGALALTITGQGRKQGEGPLLVPGTPCMIPAGPYWKPFEISADTPVQALAHGLSGLELSFVGSGGGGVMVRNCHFSVQPTQLPCFTGCDVKLY